MTPVVRLLDGREAGDRVPELSAVLMDCVDGGASVSFMAPLARERADAFWRQVAEGLAAGDRLLVVAEDGRSGEIVGTVQVVFGCRRTSRTAATWRRCWSAAPRGARDSVPA